MCDKLRHTFLFKVTKEMIFLLQYPQCQSERQDVIQKDWLSLSFHEAKTIPVTVARGKVRAQLLLRLLEVMPDGTGGMVHALLEFPTSSLKLREHACKECSY